MKANIVALYEAGSSLRLIGEAYGRSKTWVRKRLIDAGVDIRSARESKKVGRLGAEVLCKTCGTMVYRKPNKVARNLNTFCSRQCYALSLKLSMRGSRNHQWHGGRSIATMIRHSVRNKEWIQFILERDDFTCRHCHQRGVHLHVHHIYPFASILDRFLEQNSSNNIELLLEASQEFEEFFDIDNGISLCRECHKEVHHS